MSQQAGKWSVNVVQERVDLAECKKVFPYGCATWEARLHWHGMCCCLK